MNDDYTPASSFLQAAIADEVRLSGSGFAKANLRQLIALTQDKDLSNRDWATVLLALEEANSSEVMHALLAAAQGESDIVRAEALVGIARRDRTMAFLSFSRHSRAVRGACPCSRLPNLLQIPR